MKRKNLLLILLLALGVPLAMNAQSSLPFSENFNLVTEGELPTGWTPSVITGQGTVEVVRETNPIRQYLAFAVTRLNNNNLAGLQVMLPANTAGNWYKAVSFKLMAGVNAGTFQMGYLTTNNNVFPPTTTWTSLATYNASDFTPGTWQTITVPVALATGQTLCFRTSTTTANTAWGIDDLSISDEGLVPTNLAANASQNSATITWDANLANNWQLHYRALGEINWSTSQPATTNSYTLADLQPGTTYEVQVRARIRPDRTWCYSGWSETLNFATAAPAHVPYPGQNHEIFYELHSTMPYIFLPDNWNGAVSPVGEGIIQMHYEAPNPNFPDFKEGWLRMEVTGNPGMNNPVTLTTVLPVFDRPVNLLKTRLLIKPSSTVNTYCNNLLLGYITGNDFNTFTQLESYSASDYSTTDYTLVEKVITGIPANARLAIRYTANYVHQQNSYWDVDYYQDAESMVSEVVPTNLQVASSTDTEATFTWDVVSGVNYDLQYRTYDKATNQMGEWTSQIVTAGTYTLPIENRYRYFAKVRALGYDDQNTVYYTDFTDETSLFPGEAMVTEFPYSQPFNVSSTEPITYNNLHQLTPPHWYYHNGGNAVTLSSEYGYERNDVYCYLPRLFDGQLLFFVQDLGNPTFNPQPEYAISPKMHNIRDLQLSFHAYGYRADSYGATDIHPMSFKVGVMTDPLDPSTFVLVKTFTINPSADIDELYFYDLPNNIPEDAHIAFMVEPYANWKSVLSIDDVVVSVAPNCKPTHELTVGEVPDNSVPLYWNGYNNDTWQIAYQQKTAAGDDEPWQTVIVETEAPDLYYILTGLNHGTFYNIKVRSYCGESEQGEWSNVVTVRTGCANTYQEVTYYEDFESYEVGDEPSCWYNYGNPPIYSPATVVQHNGVKALMLCPPALEGGLDYSVTQVYLPKMENLKNLKIRFRAKRDNGSQYGHLTTLYIRVADSYGHGTEAVKTIDFASVNQWQEFEVFMMNGESYENGYIELYTNNFDMPVTYDEINKIYIDWIEVSLDVDYNKTFTGTTSNLWNVASNWEPAGVPGPTDNVLIPNDKNVIIPSGCVADVNAIQFLSPGNLTVKDGAQLKFNYGQRRSGDNAAWTHLKWAAPKIEKHFECYTDISLRDHYILMSFPKSEGISLQLEYFLPLYSGQNNTTIHGFVDCYLFNGSYRDNEWVNCKYYDVFNHVHTSPVLAPGSGFLYSISAWADDVYKDLAWQNLRVPSSRDVIEKELDWDNQARFGRWNLVGNPFMCDAYMVKHNNSQPTPWDYWVMNSAGDGLVLGEAGAPIGPMEGAFVQSDTYTRTLVFRTTPLANRANSIDFTVRAANTRATDVADRARIRLGDGEDVDYCNIMPSRNRLYIPGDDKQMTVKSVGNMGEVPLNFEASANGRYTVSFKNDIEDLAYCHLIDNKTGADIDLLETPEYTFDAKVSDYPSRFRVLFEANNDPTEDPNAEETVTFAYFSNGNLVVSNDGVATLQLIDVTGRVISSEQINGCTETRINAAPGVYILRLISGDKVKVQKIVNK